jgi:hypothetical protein
MISITHENLHELHKAMRPLLHNFMAPPLSGTSTNTTNPDEAADTIPSSLLSPQDALDLHHISLAYLPAILLAYTGALTFASTITGPEILLKTLDLANLLANPSNAHLVDIVVEAGRMVDLVEGLTKAQVRLLRMRQDEGSVERRETKRGGVKVRAVRKKRSRLLVGGRDWRGESLDLWDGRRGGEVPP